MHLVQDARHLKILDPRLLCFIKYSRLRGYTHWVHLRCIPMENLIQDHLQASSLSYRKYSGDGATTQGPLARFATGTREEGPEFRTTRRSFRLEGEDLR